MTTLRRQLFIAHEESLLSRLNLAHVARHQFDFRVLKRLAALVVHRDPADKIEQIAVLRRDDVVIGFPTHPAGDVGQFGVELARLVAVQLPLDCRL